MNCFKEQQIFDLINNELTEDTSQLIKDHIKECSICKDKYEQIIEEVSLLKSSVSSFDDSAIDIPDFIFPEDRQPKRYLKFTPLIVKLSIAASILFLISISILINSNKNVHQIDLEYVQMQQNNAISDMNEAWSNKELLFTQFNQETGETKVFLSSEIDN